MIDEQQHNEQQHEELSNACREVYPYIRHLLLMDSNPAAAAAVTTIAKAAGVDDPIAEAISRAAMAGATLQKEVMCDVFQNHRLVGRTISRAAGSAVLEDLRATPIAVLSSPVLDVTDPDDDSGRLDSEADE